MFLWGENVLIRNHLFLFFRNCFLNMAGKKKAPTKAVSKKTTKPVVDEKEKPDFLKKSEVKEWVHQIPGSYSFILILLRT